MSADSRSISVKEADKNRIRENQRRSRRKRKEYLQEVEEKLRKCHFQGVEISIEIQAEARKVAEENKKLRTLLNRHGIVDECISEFLDTGTVAPPRHPVPDHIHTAAVGTTVRNLERLLKPQRPRCLEPCEPFCSQPSLDGYSRPVDAVTSLKSRETSRSTSIWEIPAHQDGLGGSMASHEGRYQPTHYITAPESGTSLHRTDAAMALKHLGGSIKADRPSPTSLDAGSAAVPGEPLPQPPYDYNLFSSSSGYGQPYPNRQRISLQGPAGSLNMSSNYLHAPRTENNCSMTADILSGMTGLDHHHVRGQLGCMPGIDCQVDNAGLGNVVDGYTTATTMGL